MRQAIVITNPKWEPFTKASDAFAKATAPAILVVRGRSKEKRVAGDKKFAFKAKPDSPEALAADMRKTGASKEEIEKAVKAFKK